ncbi:MAG: hypothetical protein OXC48_07590 [Endozoicomonadaceae bacterium]|nr:hypothetical protein [Endozoicomonadaceae bacterium]
MIIHELKKVLPDLNASVIDVANCVKHLTLEADQDLFAAMLLSPFKIFCEKDSERPKALLEYALTEVDKDFDHLSTAIEAGTNIDKTTYTNKAIELLKNENDLIKQRAIFALGKISYQDKMLLKRVALAVKEASASLTDDVILATSMQSLFDIVIQDKDLEKIFLKFLDDHSEHLNEHYIHTAAQILFSDETKTSPAIEQQLLDICCHTEPENKKTIGYIDCALKNILKRKNFDACVNFLECFFELSNYKLSVKHFDNFVCELNKHKDTYLSSLLTRWLLSKNLYLGKFSYDLIIINNFNHGATISFDRSCFPNDSQKRVRLFLTRKAVGWFFQHPQIVMSLIESLMPDMTEEELTEVQKLIFHPLCISYPDCIPKRIEELKKSSQDKVAKTAANILSDYENYQQSVKAALAVNELKPSEQNRHTYRKHHNKLMKESIEQAESKSIISLFACNKLTLLYGNKSVYYIHHDDKKIRQEVPLHEINHSFEFASLHNIDPHGLENIILQLRAEGCTS